MWVAGLDSNPKTCPLRLEPRLIRMLESAAHLYCIGANLRKCALFQRRFHGFVREIFLAPIFSEKKSTLILPDFKGGSLSRTTCFPSSRTKYTLQNYLCPIYSASAVVYKMSQSRVLFEVQLKFVTIQCLAQQFLRNLQMQSKPKRCNMFRKSVQIKFLALP